MDMDGTEVSPGHDEAVAIDVEDEKMGEVITLDAFRKE